MADKHWSCNLTPDEIADQTHAILVGVIDDGDDIAEALDAIQVMDDALPEAMTNDDKRLHAALLMHCPEYQNTFVEPTHDDLVNVATAIDTWRNRK